MAAELLLIRFPEYAMALILYSYLHLDLEGKMAASLFRHAHYFHNKSTDLMIKFKLRVLE